jgi:hypothetical protein
LRTRGRQARPCTRNNEATQGPNRREEEVTADLWDPPHPSPVTRRILMSGADGEEPEAAGNAELDRSAATAAALQQATRELMETSAELLEEVTSMVRPPPVVGKVLEAVCTLKGEQSDWDSARRMMGDTEAGFSAQTAGDFLRSMETFDVAAVSSNVFDHVRQIAGQQGFSAEAAARAGIVSGRLCAWVVAVLDYHSANHAAGGG